MHIHTILLENPSKVKKILINKKLRFLKKTKIEKNVANARKIRQKEIGNNENLSNFSINCLTNPVDGCRISL